jgi:hypothetical protein
VCGARICGSAGHELSFVTGEIEVFLVDRGRLEDREMVARATDTGAELLLEACVTAINPEKYFRRTKFPGMRRFPAIFRSQLMDRAVLSPENLVSLHRATSTWGFRLKFFEMAILISWSYSTMHHQIFPPG